MKRLTKKLSYTLYLVSATVLLTSCNYTERTLIEFKDMEEPIVLQYKEKDTFFYSVVLKDGKGKCHKFGNISVLANYIGDNYQINDTIPK